MLYMVIGSNKADNVIVIFYSMDCSHTRIVLTRTVQVIGSNKADNMIVIFYSMDCSYTRIVLTRTVQVIGSNKADNVMSSCIPWIVLTHV